MAIYYEEMNRKSIIRRVEDFVKNSIREFDCGHDWHHITRVRRLALEIGYEENAGNPLAIELASLLHETGDSKFRKPGDRGAGELISELLGKLEVERDIINEVVEVNRYISFSSKLKQPVKSTVLKIVQDADRLDAIGAIGIARAFSYGGFRNHPLYNPDENNMLQEGPGIGASTIAHFYEKLLLLKDMMNTETGRIIAEERHLFLQKFLEVFHKEWRFGAL
jgi:uncharacterized protein